MSLINDMLRDLSAHQTARPDHNLDDISAADWEQQKLFHFFNKQSRLPIILLSVVLFIVLLFGFRWLSQYDFYSVSSKPITLEEVKPEAAIVQQPLVAAPIENSVVLPAEVSVPEQNIIPEQKTIYELIDKASRALALDRLTSPEQDNAYYYYQSLLTIDAENAVAQAGLLKIVQRYQHMVEKSIGRQDFMKAQAYLEKLLMVSGSVELSEVDTNKNQYLSEKITAALATPRVLAENDSELPSNPISTIQDSAEQVAFTPENSETVTNPLAVVQSAVRTPNPEFVDEQSVNQARKLVESGKLVEAIDILQLQIQSSVSPLSEAYLLDIYYQQQDLSAMQSLLANTSIPDVQKAYYQARAYLLSGDNQLAISALETQLAQAKTDENFRALLAGLYQKEGMFSQAITAYRNLLQEFIPQPAYWLGFALSLDAQGQSKTAIFAYQKLLEFNSLDTQVVAYAQNRINELSH